MKFSVLRGWDVTQFLALKRKWAERNSDALQREDDRMLLAVWINDRPIGSIGVNRVSPHIKMRHRAQFGISIERAYWNMGLGTILIKEALEAARKMGCEQVELGVYSDNERARALYRKLGFEEWGVVRNAYRLKDGAYCDEIMMGRSL